MKLHFKHRRLEQLRAATSRLRARLRWRLLALTGSFALVACVTPPNGIDQASATHDHPVMFATSNARASNVPSADIGSTFTSVAEALPPANDPPSTLDGKPLSASPDVSTFAQNGRASWYGPRFNGRKTASGERYDMDAMTAAHRTLPMSSYVRVTNVKNGKSVVVKINDRGPYFRGRIIDLSRAAALALGMQRAGTGAVKLQGLSNTEGTEALAAQTESLASR
ncbi:septal ring lytic transglycosylase RlpA family protein [Pararobbsia alpina]|uniref:Endolytic peptidoglycan transglycosylase RlpA n=1 Tax=Pararobbsia alpina TaxID=621374 RepID=A0A6S7CDW2_9BURK|nr:septal ring lytic transglycosylase RlpA family protein [Pararobbsia alpina]CAB3778331.1 Endolytic peptidoglycan transglycosylase RlpA [Pararobbsia alpina]